MEIQDAIVNGQLLTDVFGQFPSLFTTLKFFGSRLTVAIEGKATPAWKR
jgi:hypothetical protein